MPEPASTGTRTAPGDFASVGARFVAPGISGVEGVFCISPGKIKSKGEIDLLALMPLQPLPTMARSANRPPVIFFINTSTSNPLASTRQRLLSGSGTFSPCHVLVFVMVQCVSTPGQLSDAGVLFPTPPRRCALRSLFPPMAPAEESRGRGGCSTTRPWYSASRRQQRRMAR